MSESSNQQSSALMRAALAGSALLVVAGLATFWWAAGAARKAPQAAQQAVTVTIRGHVCDPGDITVPAGRTTFTIVNQSQRALEWEILDGVRVVEERENIAPGFSQTMTVKLQPGEYDITCGLLSNPRGRLHVTPTAESAAEAARPPQLAYVGPLAEYRVYLALGASDLLDAVQALATAIETGDAAQARALYVPAHQAYLRLEPMAELFADLDQQMNARADYFEKREADPGFAGFHRLEYGLFAPGQGHVKELAPVAAQLQANAGELATRLRALDIPPERLASAAAKLLRRVADALASGQGSHGLAEAARLQATLEGTQKIAGLLAPLLAKAAPGLHQSLETEFAACATALAPYREGEGENARFKPESLSSAQRQALAALVHELADKMGQVNAALGLE